MAKRRVAAPRQTGALRSSACAEHRPCGRSLTISMRSPTLARPNDKVEPPMPVSEGAVPALMLSGQRSPPSGLRPPPRQRPSATLSTHHDGAKPFKMMHHQDEFRPAPPRTCARASSASLFDGNFDTPQIDHACLMKAPARVHHSWWVLRRTGFPAPAGCRHGVLFLAQSQRKLRNWPRVRHHWGKWRSFRNGLPFGDEWRAVAMGERSLSSRRIGSDRERCSSIDTQLLL